MAIARGVRTVITGICAGITTVTTVRWMNTASQLSQKQALAISVRDLFIPNWKIGTASSMNFVSIFVTDDDEPNDSPYVLPINAVGSGTLGPTQIAIQLNLLSGTHGRRGRGRLFIPGIRNTAFPNSQLDGSILLSANTQIANIKNAYGPSGTSEWRLGVYSRKDNQIRQVVDITINNLPSALRSRKIGVGI